jgi:hypothetical protein
MTATTATSAWNDSTALRDELLPDGWQRVDLGPALRGELEKIEPTILRRDDGAALFYPGQLNWIHGADGVGKSWVALIAAAQEITAGHNVEWVNFEDPDERVVVDRLLDIGIDPETIAEHFYYRGPTDPFDETVVDQLITCITDDDVTLVVIDSLGEALGLGGGNENDDPDITNWVRTVARTIIAAGAAVIVVDHGTKAADNPLFASGSKRKRAAITGVGYLIEAPSPLTKANGGRLRLTCAKDRHGNFARGEQVATIDFGRYPDGGLTVHVRQVLATEQKPTDDQTLRKVARAIVRTVRDAHRPLSKNEIMGGLKEGSIKARSEVKRGALDHAVGMGALRPEPGPRGAVLHHFVHELEDDE